MNLGYRLLSLATGAVAGLVARQVVTLVWEKGLGKATPNGDETDLDLPLAQIATFSAVTAGVTALVNEAMQRKTAQWYGARNSEDKA
ncbi:DUF4235 domain-containing protein [Arcanobacterium pinnipediorum]|uniref:DUF4235 domain-containing protein n=1 Tax=Arcanobacterium pinnipediorum TaxID=1503041 RepID=A0ABY5AIH1_9ACTO|nr:DUF4235 domain-containing protein [Arcanobacterium pinnipediorum]USR79541.1 DUF4235 domain-containing protein [Arcanobacterium pinnipediorum]